MLENIENIKLLEVVSGISLRQQTYTDRWSNAFVYKVSGQSDYTFGTRVISLCAGEVLFIPKGSDYRVEQISPGESRYVLINFAGECAGAVPKVYSLEGFGDAGALGTSVARLWLFGAAGEHYKCTAVFYNLLSFLAKKESAQYAHTKHMNVIEPAMEYLKSHLFDCDLRVGELCRLCGVSDVYFRRIFKGSFGVTPQEYVTNKRMTQAAALISSGDCESVRQVAASVGYSDALYFSRLFARQYGCSPSGYQK